MSIPLTIHDDQFTQQLDQYVQEYVATAADSTWSYKKKEAAMRADGAIRIWMALFMVEAMKLGPDAEKRFGEDLVRLRPMVQNIPVDDQS